MNKYQLLYCILQYVHEGTWWTLVKNWRFFWEKKPVSVKSIHDLEDSFSDKSLWLSINRLCLLPDMYVFAIVREGEVICAVAPILIILKQLRCLLDILESAVPAIFLSYAPTYFSRGFTQRGCNACNLQNT